MSNIGKQADFLHGIPIVSSTAERDVRFPLPDTTQRVQNLETGYIERYTGSTWSQEMRLGPGGGGLTVFNVRAAPYNAACDGSANDTTAIQRAIDDADPNGSTPGIVYLPGNGAASIYSVTNLVIPPYTILMAPSWQHVLLRARSGTTGYMVTDSGNATAIRIIGLGIDGNNQNVSGVRLGYTDLGANSFNLGAFLKDVRAQRCQVYGFDVQANVAELEDCWAADGNGIGMRLGGIAVRANRIACQSSTTTELEIVSRLADITGLHIETGVTGTAIKFLAGSSGSVLRGCSLAIDSGVTVSKLVDIAATVQGVDISGFTTNLDAAGSAYTNFLVDNQNSITIPWTSFTDPRYPGAYTQALRATYFGDGVTIGGDVNAGGGYRQTVDGWYQENVVASQTDVALARLATTTDNPAAWIAPRAGSVTAIAIHSNAARTNGTLTAKVFKNGSVFGSLTAVIDGTNTTFKATTQAKDTSTFAAGDRLEVRITTDGSWTPTTADVRGVLEVET